MQLPGRLGPSTLGDLLGALHRQRTTGFLELSERASPNGRTVPGRRHRVHLALGLVVGVESQARVPPLGEMLREGGHVPNDGVTHLLRRVADGDARPAGEILIAEGLVSREIVGDTLRAQLLVKLEALFAIEEATVTFHIARAGTRRVGPLEPADFLHGRPRGRDRRSARSGKDAVRTDAARASALRTLGLAAGADEATVKRTFRKLARELHPDRCSTAPQAERAQRAALFARVSAAYHALVA